MTKLSLNKQKNYKKKKPPLKYGLNCGYLYVVYIRTLYTF